MKRQEISFVIESMDVSITYAGRSWEKIRFFPNQSISYWSAGGWVDLSSALQDMSILRIKSGNVTQIYGFSFAHYSNLG